MVKLWKPQIRVFRRWFKKVLFVGFIVAVLTAGFYLIFKSDFLVIKNVNCWVKDKTSIADEKRWCERAERMFLGQRIFRTHSTTVVDELVRRFLPVGNVVVKKKYPQTVLVQIGERKPIVKICSSKGREFLVDKEGVIYSEVQPEWQGLKTVVLELGSELALGQTIDANIVLLILLEEPQVSSVKFAGQTGIEVKGDEELTILFSREKELAGQIRSLQMIVKKYKIEGKELKQVDLRYDQPVVQY